MILPAVFRNGRLEARLARIEHSIRQIWATLAQAQSAALNHNVAINGLSEQLHAAIDVDNKLRPFDQFDRGFGLGAPWKQ